MGAAVFIVLAYLISSIPVGVLLSRLRGKDPRKVGSGNIGATNVMRTAGKAFGILTLLGDVAKGFAPVCAALYAGLPQPLIAAVGFAAFFGHICPVFLGFRGGKGVATALGVYLALNALAILLSMAVFILVLWKWRYVSAGSLAGTVLMPVFLYALKAPAMYVYLSLVIGCVIVFKHRDNIKRLMAGKEHKFRG